MFALIVVNKQKNMFFGEDPIDYYINTILILFNEK